MELPKYKCHKEVRALKIVSISTTSFKTVNLFFGVTDLSVSAEWFNKNKPEVGGYYVVYEDGYKSYSPAEAFESGYTLISE